MKNYSWQRIAGTIEELVFNDDNISLIEINGKALCLGRHRDQVFVFAHKCPHAGAELSAGWIDAKGNIVCPLHGYRFSLETGRNITGEGYHLKHWPVEQREDGLYVGMDEGSFNLP